MPTTASVNLVWDDRKISLVNEKAKKGLFRLGFDIAAQARRNAPYVTGALRSTIRVQNAGDDAIEVIAGGTFAGRSVPYAWIREQGPNRNPATEHYMENAKNSIMSGDYMNKYFGGLI